jgi:hypothetical protein
MTGFWDRVDRRSDAECWPWLGSSDRDGYGLVTVRKPKRRRGAHRVALALSLGVDVDELRGCVVRHSCDNPPCCNPAHLSSGTQADNMSDAWDKGRGRGFQFRTHCSNGHAIQPGNLYIDRRTGKRRCAECHRARQRAYHAARPA